MLATMLAALRRGRVAPLVRVRGAGLHTGALRPPAGPLRRPSAFTAHAARHGVLAVRYSAPAQEAQDAQQPAADEGAAVAVPADADMSGYVGRLFGACVVTRLPSLTPDVPEWMSEYEEHWIERRNWMARPDPDEAKARKQASGQQSKKSLKKMKRAEEKKKAKAAAKGAKDAKEGGGEQSSSAPKQQSSQESDADAAVAAATASASMVVDEEYEPAPRTTKADRVHDVHSLQRALSKRLYLIVRPTSAHPLLATMGDWVFPGGAWELGESMRKTAHRNLRDACGKSVRIYVYGNAPHAHLPLVGDDDHTVFFYQARHLTGSPKLAQAYADYAWVTKDEMEQYFSEPFFNFTQRMLWD